MGEGAQGRIGELVVETLAAGGPGVGRWEGRACFVPGAAPGDRLRVRVRRDRGRWLEAESLELLAPGPARVDPPCPVAGDCGGCQWQHVAAEVQREARAAIVREALRRIGGLDDPPAPAFAGGGPEFGYRRRAVYHGEAGPGGIRVGFHGAGSHRIVEHERCLLLEAPLADALGGLRERLDRPLRAAGRFTLEATLLAGPALQVLVRAEVPLARALAGALDGWAAPGMAATHLSVRAAGGGGTLREAPGAPFLLEDDEFSAPGGGGLRCAWWTRPGEFVQANRHANRRLVEDLLALAAPRPESWVLDLFCGAGNFSLPLAAAGARVLGVEERAVSVRSARKAARELGLARARFRAGAAGDVLADLVAADRRYDLVVLDPPRRGAPELAARLDALGRPRLLAVSCHPAAFARDLAAWRRAGYALRELRLYDFFPQTAHVELLADLAPA